jgi:NADH-quinone oxidoreductase subunit J
MGLEILQWTIAAFTVMAALGVVLGKNPVVCALSLMVTMFLTGLLYFAQGAYFPGVVQILIYAGAISVLFIFIVMLLDLKPTRILIPGRKLIIGLGFLAAGTLGLALLFLVYPTFKGTSLVSELDVEPVLLSAQKISVNLLTKYMMPFQATALLILAALMGAVMIGRAGQRKDRS